MDIVDKYKELVDAQRNLLKSQGLNCDDPKVKHQINLYGVHIAKRLGATFNNISTGGGLYGLYQYDIVFPDKSMVRVICDTDPTTFGVW